MATIERYRGQPLPIIVQFPSNPFLTYGKDYSDITEVTMNLKKDLANDADNAYLEKLYSTNGVEIDEATHKFTMNISEIDYNNLTDGDTYYLVMAVELNGYSEFIEMAFKCDVVEVAIKSDKNRK